MCFGKFIYFGPPTPLERVGDVSLRVFLDQLKQMKIRGTKAEYFIGSDAYNNKVLIAKLSLYFLNYE